MSEIYEGAISELADQLASELGLSLGQSEVAQVAMVFVSTEALKAGLEILLPTMASGIGFSATGLTLAVISRKIKELHKKMDVVLDSARMIAKDQLEEAMVAFENGSFRDAQEGFKKVGDRCTEALNMSQDTEGRIQAAKMKLLTIILVKSFDEKTAVFIPFQALTKSRQREIAMLMKSTVDKLLDLNTLTRPSIVDNVMFKNKVKRKMKSNKINPILISVYPFLTRGLGWTNPKQVIDVNSDVVQIEIDPKFVPMDEENSLTLPVGKDKTGKIIDIKIYRSTEHKTERLYVESNSFELKDMSSNIFMLEIFRGKIAAFKDEQSLLLSAARIGRREVIASLFSANPELNVNGTNHIGESALTLAVQNNHAEIALDLLMNRSADGKVTDAKENNILHHAVLRDCDGIAKQLLKRDPILASSRNIDGSTPLALAVEKGHFKVGQLLLKQSTSEIVNTPKNDGSTPLFIAAKTNHIPFAKAILKSGALVNESRNSDQMTPLMIACDLGHKEMVKMLAKTMNTEDLATVNKEGLTARDICKKKSDGKDLAEFLERLESEKSKETISRKFIKAASKLNLVLNVQRSVQHEGPQ